MQIASGGSVLRATVRGTTLVLEQYRVAASSQQAAHTCQFAFEQPGPNSGLPCTVPQSAAAVASDHSISANRSRRILGNIR